MDLSDLGRLITPIKLRIMNLVARAVIKLADDKSAQVEAHADEIRDEVTRLQEYGFSSRPKPGAEAVVLFIGGNRDHGVVVATGDSRYRPALEEGEVALWTQDVVIKIKADKTVEITGATKLKMSGDLEVAGEVTAKAGTPAAVKLSTHMHPTATPGSPSPPTPGT